MNFAFPFDAECFLKEDWSQIGVADGYGAVHWAPRKQLQEVRDRFLEEFADQIGGNKKEP
ncbi:hypothetical protein GCM10007385_35720 [Tateyamaria omphalii]|nr:hypothetical protein GCM10007385_35720 [Tateyamaria omphalii]